MPTATFVARTATSLTPSGLENILQKPPPPNPPPELPRPPKPELPLLALRGVEARVEHPRAPLGARGHDARKPAHDQPGRDTGDQEGRWRHPEIDDAMMPPATSRGAQRMPAIRYTSRTRCANEARLNGFGDLVSPSAATATRASNCSMRNSRAAAGAAKASRTPKATMKNGVICLRDRAPLRPISGLSTSQSTIVVHCNKLVAPKGRDTLVAL